MIERQYSFICCNCTLRVTSQTHPSMAHIGFLHALRGLQPNQNYELTSEELWKLVRTAGIKLKPSQSGHQDAKRYKNHQNYQKYVNSRITDIIEGTMDRFESKFGVKMEEEEIKTLQKPQQVSLSKKKQDFQNNFPTLLKELDQQITCSICLDILVLPVVTNCGHAYCYQCIDEHLLFSSSCPNCREDIKESKLKIDPTVQQLIKSLLGHCDDEQKTMAYQQRLEKNLKWKSQREISAERIQIGYKVDIRDTEQIWCKGEITQIYYKKNEVNSVLVHYDRWHKMYDEVIDFPTIRIAPLGYFTSRNNISYYNLTQTENNLRGHVQVSTAVVNQVLPDGNDSDSNSNNDPNEQPEPAEEHTHQHNFRIFVERFTPDSAYSSGGFNTRPQQRLYFYPYPHPRFHLGVPLVPLLTVRHSNHQNQTMNTQENMQDEDENDNDDGEEYQSMEIEERESGLEPESQPDY